ncbi:MAG: hypothetical protein RL311_540, partial [Bacteroidota bacterium]
NKLGINKHWFSKTTKGIAMKSCIYFTATRNIMASDVVHVFENILSLGIVYEKYVNIVPVSNKNYNHVFFKIQWNDNVETANFVNEIVMKSYVKVFHNKGYWVCRMSNNPLKLRNLSKCVKVASFYCDNSESDADSESDSQEQNVTIQVKETNEEEDKVSTNEEEDKVSTNQEEDFYVIKEEFKEEINSVVE